MAKAVDVAATEGGRHSSGLTSLGVALGTPAYMSPEQASADSQVDHRADIYSLGVMAYEMLAGASPFANRPPQQMLARRTFQSRFSRVANSCSPTPIPSEGAPTPHRTPIEKHGGRHERKRPKTAAPASRRHHPSLPDRRWTSA